MKLIVLLPLLFLMGCQPKDLSTRNNCTGNCKDGYGTYIWEDGKTYKGYWANYRKHGEGTLSVGDGTAISGMWENDVLKSAGIAAKSDKTIVATTQAIPAQIIKPISENRTALLVGNSKYNGKWFVDLKNPVNDLKVMKKTLEDLGFKVTSKMDSSRREIIDSLYEFGSDLKKRGGVGLFLYSGHGLQLEGDNYIIPSNTENLNFLEDVKYEAINLQAVLDVFEGSGTRINLAIFDACRDNAKGVIPNRTQTRSILSRGFNTPNIKTNQTVIAYSTAPNTIALDGDGNNSPYISALSNSLQKKGLTIESVFKEVKKKVAHETNNKQQPWVAASISEELVLNP